MVPSTILELIQLALTVFAQIWAIFHPGKTPTPATMIAHLTSVPGLTDDQKAVITSAVTNASIGTAV